MNLPEYPFHKYTSLSEYKIAYNLINASSRDNPVVGTYIPSFLDIHDEVQKTRISMESIDDIGFSDIDTHILENCIDTVAWNTDSFLEASVKVDPQMSSSTDCSSLTPIPCKKTSSRIKFSSSIDCSPVSKDYTCPRLQQRKRSVFVQNRFIDVEADCLDESNNSDDLNSSFKSTSLDGFINDNSQPTQYLNSNSQPTADFSLNQDHPSPEDMMAFYRKTAYQSQSCAFGFENPPKNFAVRPNFHPVLRSDLVLSSTTLESVTDSTHGSANPLDIECSISLNSKINENDLKFNMENQQCKTSIDDSHWLSDFDDL